MKPEELSKLNITDLSIHFSGTQDFENDFITPLNIMMQYLNDNNVTIGSNVNIHLCHKKDMSDNNSVFYNLKRLFPNNKIYWWNLMGHNSRDLMFTNLSRLKESAVSIFIYNKNLDNDEKKTTFNSYSKNFLYEFDLATDLKIPTILIK